MTDSAARRADLVFEGGGVKGIGLAGAFRELDDQRYAPQCVAGTSAGAITAALVAAGYRGAELEKIVLHDMQFQKFADHRGLARFGAPGELAAFLKTRGLHSGDYFLAWIRKLLTAKGIRHFADLRDPAAGEPARQYRLQVIASDLSQRSLLVLPRDADQLGCSPDELEVALAVRMSMSIPVFFKPVTVTDRTGQRHVIVDGGLLSNFPVWLFDCSGRRPSFPTFGLLLQTPGQSTPLVAPKPGAEPRVGPIKSNLSFFRSIGETMMEAHDRLYVASANYARTIPIPTLGVGTTEFGIAPQRARDLFESGRTAARAFLSTWDFDAWVAQFRPGTPAPATPAA